METLLILQVKALSHIGGKTADKTVKSVLSALISPGVGAQFSWVGAKKKRRFRDLKYVWKLVVGM